MVKTLTPNNQRNLTDDSSRKSRLTAGGRKREELTRMGKSSELRKAAAAAGRGW